MLSGIYRGDRNALIANPRDIEALVKEIANTKPAMIPAVNTLFNALVHNENFKNLDFSSLKIAMGGGMSVQPSVAKAWKEVTGVFILEGYGLSETSPIATAVPPQPVTTPVTSGFLSQALMLRSLMMQVSRLRSVSAVRSRSVVLR